MVFSNFFFTLNFDVLTNISMKRIFLLLSFFVFVAQSCTSQTVKGDAPENIPEFTFYTLKANLLVERA